jgi:hypothetical protein
MEHLLLLMKTTTKDLNTLSLAEYLASADSVAIGIEPLEAFISPGPRWDAVKLFFADILRGWNDGPG